MLKYLSTVFVLFLLNNLSYSQSTFSYGLKLQGEANNLKPVFSPDLILELSESEEGGIGIGFSVGGIVEWEFSNKFFFRTGIDFEQSTFKKSTFGVTNVDPQLFPINPSVIEERLRVYAFSQSFQLGLKFGNSDRLKYVVSLGSYFSLPVFDVAKTEIKHETIPTVSYGDAITRRNDWYLGGAFSFGIEYKFNEKFTVGLEPYLRYAEKEFMFFAIGTIQESNYDLGLTVNLKF